MHVLEQFSLRGKKALVTGAARGLGRSIALGLAEAGADLFLLDRHFEWEVAAEIRQMDRICFTLETDLVAVGQNQAKEIIAQSIDQMNGLDILVNNAGIIRRKPTIEYSENDWQAVLDVNLNSTFYLSQAAGLYFLNNSIKGKIINLASMLSFQGGFMVSSYTATKSALAGLTKALANEWAPYGINVNAIAPGYFITEVTAGIRSEATRNQAVLDRIPAGRYGDPSELKGLVVFLASSASDYMHGTIVPIDGGWLAR